VKIILFSSLVSIVTLVVLLFNRSTPKEIKIPSAFLGGKRMTVPRRLTLTRPPWALWFLVLLGTIGAAMAYLPPKREGRSEGTKTTGLVWIDNTFSAAISRTDGSFDADHIVSELLSLEIPLVGLVAEMQVVDAKPVQTVRLVPLESRPQISKFLLSVVGAPASALTRPLRVEDLSTSLALDTRFSAGKGTLVLVTDAQRSTLRNFISLRSFFQNVKILASHEPESMSGIAEQLVPGELLQAWSGSVRAETSGDWVALSDRDERVPAHARPGVVRESFAKETQENPLRIISAQLAPKEIFPLTIVCSTAPSGTLEFDALGDLRSFLRFFSSSFRFENCDEETQAGLQLDKNEWRFRRAAVWIVPQDNDVAQTLASGRIWIPRGFLPGNDTLVYVAPTRLAEQDESLLSLRTVQMDPGNAPSLLFLAPQPPGGHLRMGTGVKGAADRTLSFAPIFSATDGTELGFQTTNANIFYLRTTLVMPNGELARSGDWTRFWITVGKTVGRASPGLRMVTLNDWSDLASFFATLDAETSFSLFLDPQTLQLQQTRMTDGLAAGIHVAPATMESILLDIPTEERSRDYVAAKDFEQGWNQNAEMEPMGEKVQREKRTLPLTGVIVAALALFALWLFKPRFIISALLLGLGLSAGRNDALAQVFDSKFVNVQNVPFRISWCDENVPSVVSNRYRDLRETLARRGTIRLPDDILGGRCRTGMSEIWWTDSPEMLKPKEIAAHIAAGGAFVLEGQKEAIPTAKLAEFALPPVGLVWEKPARRGMLYRSFYLLHSFDGCLDDKAVVLRLRKKVNAQSIVGISSSVRFLGQGTDCFAGNDEMRARSFVNLLYALLTTDYKEDHMQLPELLSRVRNLGLEP
jgi:hypothetical protein